MKRFFYKDCAIDIFIEGEITKDELTIKGYYATVELPNENGSIDSELKPTKEAALYEGIQLYESWRLIPF